MKNILTVRSAFGALALLMGLSWTAPRLAAEESRLYVDTDWKGWHSNGTAAAPWPDLTPDTWSTITKRLAAGPVTVFFNSRQHRMGRGVDLTRASANSFGKNRLTFDGNSFYHPDESQAQWTPETDSAQKAPMEWFNSEDKAHLKRSMVTIRGFRLTAGAGQKAVSIAGDDWVLESCDCSQLQGTTKGPCVLVVPTADHKHVGSGAYVAPCTNIVIRGNEVHDSYGEAIYVGGGGSQPGEAGSGYPSHDQILIESNIIHDAGSRGKQGDGIDVKGGIGHVTIRGNDIYHLSSFESRCDVRTIVMEGQAPGLNQSYLIERNRLHDCTGIMDGAIALADTWGLPQRVIIRNNLIYNISGKPTRAPGGITIYAMTDGASICNNTICHCAGFGINLVTGSNVEVFNNLIFDNHANSAEVNLKKGVSVQSDYNAFEPPWGYDGEGAHSLSLSAADLANALMNPSAGDFRLKPGSPMAGKGEVSKMYSDDFTGRVRGETWDIGAFNSTSR
jgi:hypothetical protein